MKLRGSSFCLCLALLSGFIETSNVQKFDVCDEKTGIVQKAKATQLAAKLVDKCFLPIVSKYKYSPKMFQRAAYKMCFVFRFCFHKYNPLIKSKGSEAFREATYTCIANTSCILTVVLNPEWIEQKHKVDPRGLYYEGVSCAKKHKIMTEDPAVSLFGIKWVRDNLF
ncbi:uncharacterized protein LOC144167136 [Haemaphysalis longicornis]